MGSTEILFQLCSCRQKLNRLWILRGDGKDTAVTSWLKFRSLSVELREKWVGTVAGKHPDGKCGCGKFEPVKPVHTDCIYYTEERNILNGKVTRWNNTLLLGINIWCRWLHLTHRGQQIPFTGADQKKRCSTPLCTLGTVELYLSRLISAQEEEELPTLKYLILKKWACRP